MLTTLNFRADGYRQSVLGLIILTAAATTLLAQERAPRSIQVPPDAPRAARPQPEQPRLPTNYEVKRPVELRTVIVGRVRGEMAQLAGAEFLKSAKDPVFIAVTTAPGVLGKPALASAPVIILNGERLLSTRNMGVDKLVAFLPDREKIKETNSVAVMWIGKQEPTRTREPLTFRRADIKE